MVEVWEEEEEGEEGITLRRENNKIEGKYEKRGGANKKN